MATMTIELPSQQAQTEFNLRRWEEVLDDPTLADFEGRIETDRYGYVIMSPPAAARHGNIGARIVRLLWEHMEGGEPYQDCPVSTADGVRAPDVAWASDESMRELGNKVCFLRAPEICIEVLSPRNTRAEMDEKKRLYFDAGAREVWFCDAKGQMSFWGAANAKLEKSALCPEFPDKV